jgi:hypothetical protein
MDDLTKLDWLCNIINDGIQVPAMMLANSEPDIWRQFEDHYGGWWDTDLEAMETIEDMHKKELENPDDPNDPDRPREPENLFIGKALELTDKLEDCTPEQLEAITTLLFLAIKATRRVYGE